MTELATSLYTPIVDSILSNLENFQPEDFVPCPGSLLVVLPPPEDMAGSIILPEAAQTPSSVGLVCAISNDPECPANPGDWVFFREGAAVHMTFGGRKDLALLNYCEGAASDILGLIPQS